VFLLSSAKSNYKIVLNLRSIFSYLFAAQDEHGLHSPFVFELYLRLIKKDVVLPEFEAIQQIRAAMQQSRELIEITDFGAGSKVNASRKRMVRDVARNSEKSPRLGRLFHRIIRHFGHEYIFDLGTSLGLTTMYLATANPAAKVTTFEGCPQTAEVALRNFRANKAMKAPEIVVGNLDQTLLEQVALVPRLDFVFFDANHRFFVI
jgi:predicted O-methyltransferase YrrM